VFPVRGPPEGVREVNRERLSGQWPLHVRILTCWNVLIG
jgi:hypothetical protein